MATRIVVRPICTLTVGLSHLVAKVVHWNVPKLRCHSGNSLLTSEEKDHASCL